MPLLWSRLNIFLVSSSTLSTPCKCLKFTPFKKSCVVLLKPWHTALIAVASYWQRESDAPNTVVPAASPSSWHFRSTAKNVKRSLRIRMSFIPQMLKLCILQGGYFIKFKSETELRMKRIISSSLFLSFGTLVYQTWTSIMASSQLLWWLVWV